MRLWHHDLLPFLPRAQILGQHRECCALRGKGWGKKHSTVNYVSSHGVKRLVHYHFLVLKEMERRGYKPDQQWYRPDYRGKNSAPWSGILIKELEATAEDSSYPEHDDAYRKECLDNLRQKGIVLF